MVKRNSRLQITVTRHISHDDDHHDVYDTIADDDISDGDVDNCEA